VTGLKVARTRRNSVAMSDNPETSSSFSDFVSRMTELIDMDLFSCEVPSSNVFDSWDTETLRNNADLNVAVTVGVKRSREYSFSNEEVCARNSHNNDVTNGDDLPLCNPNKKYKRPRNERKNPGKYVARHPFLILTRCDSVHRRLTIRDLKNVPELGAMKEVLTNPSCYQYFEEQDAHVFCLLQFKIRAYSRLRERIFSTKLRSLKLEPAVAGTLCRKMVL
jgi:hypothetical protein